MGFFRSIHFRGKRLHVFDEHYALDFAVYAYKDLDQL